MTGGGKEKDEYSKHKWYIRIKRIENNIINLEKESRWRNNHILEVLSTG